MDFQGSSLRVVQNNEDKKLYAVVKWVCKGIGLTDGQQRAERKRVQEDPLLNQGAQFLKVYTNGGIQNMLCIEYNYLSIWLSSINRKSLSQKQYSITINLINFTITNDFYNLKIPNKVYQWEGELRDEIYEIGNFNGYRIIDKELSYSFGRIDLLAEDKDRGKVIIELKKHKNYNDVVVQCKKYIKGFKDELNEKVRVIICTLDEDECFIENAKENGFEVYTYKRELKLEKVS